MIFYEAKGQENLFLMLLWAGMGAGVAYDLLSLIRRRLPRGIGGLLDVMWCLGAGGLCLLSLIAGRENRLRAYALLGLCCGGGIYCLGLRRAAGGLLRRMGKSQNGQREDSP